MSECKPALRCSSWVPAAFCRLSEVVGDIGNHVLDIDVDVNMVSEVFPAAPTRTHSEGVARLGPVVQDS